MTAISCDWCAGWIERTNLGHAGFCSARCRDQDRQQRQLERDGRRAKRVAKRVEQW